MRSADANRLKTPDAPVGFSVAIAAVVAVFLLDQVFDVLIDQGALFLMLGMAVMASAWFGGTGPAIAATLAGALLAVGQETTDAPASYARLALFVLQGMVLTGIVSELRRARLQAEQDASEAQRARRESESVGRMKDEFLATVSHELRTPLHAVLGWVHLLRTGKLDEHTASRGLESIERNARLQSQLTGNLLDISRALTGRLQVESSPVSLVDVVRQATASAMPAARAKGVDLGHDLAADAVVLGDRGRLRQIVWHLLANALKFTPRGGTIGVAVTTDGDDALLKVMDSGSGIDPAFLPRVFDRFTQADSSPTRTAGGLGVGLSLVRELVELHGGQIAAANRLEGRGAVFTARFPLQPTSSLTAPALALEPGAITGSPPLDGLRVLVLDRDPEGRELVETVLRQRGATVRTVASVDDALESLEGWRPDVLVSDTGSPDRNAYSVFGKVASLEAERGGRIPALALTNLAQTDQHVRGLLASALCDLPKPVEPGLLTAEIARLTGRERRRAAR